MGTPALSIDWLPLERLPELQALIDEHWRRGHVLARDAELLRWQHPRPEQPDRLSVLVADERGRLVAMLGVIPFRACVRAERLRGGWMTTWLTVPDARGRGIGMELVRRAQADGFELIGALAANEATRHVLGDAGWAERELKRWVRVADVAALRALVGEGRYPSQAWAAWANPAPRERLPRGGECVGACRDEAFLRARYERHPRFRYERLEGAVYRLETVAGSDARVMRIVEFTGGPELARELVGAARRAGAVLADFACTSARFAAPLEAAGFVCEDDLPARLPGRFQPLDFTDRPLVSCFWIAPRVAADPGAFFAGDDLYVTRGDSDLDRPN